jgi:molybdopterin converting factor small subunit
MQITVKLSASYYTASGLDRLVMDIPEGTSVSQMLKILDNRFENVHLDHERTYVIVNEKKSSRENILRNNDTVMIFHLMGGG